VTKFFALWRLERRHNTYHSRHATLRQYLTSSVSDIIFPKNYKIVIIWTTTSSMLCYAMFQEGAIKKTVLHYSQEDPPYHGLLLRQVHAKMINYRSLIADRAVYKRPEDTRESSSASSRFKQCTFVKLRREFVSAHRRSDSQRSR